MLRITQHELLHQQRSTLPFAMMIKDFVVICIHTKIHNGDDVWGWKDGNEYVIIYISTHFTHPNNDDLTAARKNFFFHHLQRKFLFLVAHKMWFTLHDYIVQLIWCGWWFCTAVEEDFFVCKTLFLLVNKAEHHFLMYLTLNNNPLAAIYHPRTVERVLIIMILRLGGWLLKKLRTLMVIRVVFWCGSERRGGKKILIIFI